jgi:NADH-quinone oxidoreductase subunit J
VIETAIFWVFATVAIVSAFLCITRQSPVASAMWLMQTLFALAGLYVILDAQFIGVLQILVYVGAIMVLFLFVIMLLNLGRGGRSDLQGWGVRGITVLLGAGLIVELLAFRSAMPNDVLLPPGTLARAQETQGAVALVSDTLFNQYLAPFEITSVLLLAAVVGAVVLAKRKI